MFKGRWLKAIVGLGSVMVSLGIIGIMVMVLYKMVTVVNSTDDHWMLVLLGWAVVTFILLVMLIVALVLSVWSYGIINWLFIEPRKEDSQ